MVAYLGANADSCSILRIHFSLRGWQMAYQSQDDNLNNIIYGYCFDNKMGQGLKAHYFACTKCHFFSFDQ